LHQLTYSSDGWLQLLWPADRDRCRREAHKPFYHPASNFLISCAYKFFSFLGTSIMLMSWVRCMWSSSDRWSTSFFPKLIRFLS
jgi:hypothetical protein